MLHVVTKIHRKENSKDWNKKVQTHFKNEQKYNARGDGGHKTE
jgi:hypothetical protein